MNVLITLFNLMVAFTLAGFNVGIPEHNNARGDDRAVLRGFTMGFDETEGR